MNANIIVTSNNSEDFSVDYLQANCKQINFIPSKCCFEEQSSDSDKIDSLVTALESDNEIILAMRGGSGATRLMNKLTNLEKPSTPKKFIGYSDLTVLLNYLNKFDNIDLIHGPMAFELTTEKRIDKFIAALNKEDVVFETRAKWYNKKQLTGQVIGGNIMLFTDSIGTFYQPNHKGKILLIEEIDEEIKKLDRMFAQLRDSNVLGELSGIILGNFKDCATKEELLNLFDIYLKDLDIGILMDVNLGHVDDSDYIYLHTDVHIDETGIYYK